MISEVISDLNARGWWIGHYEPPLLHLAQQLGTPVPARVNGAIVDVLVVRRPDRAHPNSLSSRHGTGAFPLHVDGTHHSAVPKYVVLRLASPKPSDRGTVLVDFRGAIQAIEETRLRHELWIIRTGRRAFLAPILDGPYLRFDFDIMSPASPQLAMTPQIVRDVCARTPQSIIKWLPNCTVVIDNHRIVHGRQAQWNSGDMQEPRQLERILVRAHELESG